MFLPALISVISSIAFVWMACWRLNRRFEQISGKSTLKSEKLPILHRQTAVVVILGFLLGSLGLVSWEVTRGNEMNLGSPYLIGPGLVWLLLLVLVAATTGYRNRTRIFEENWSLGTYLNFLIRQAMGSHGFWLIALVFPPLFMRLGLAGQLLGLPALALMLCWSFYFPKWNCWWLNCRPLDELGIHARAFRKILDRSRFREIRVAISEPDHGQSVNADALPSLNEPTIVLSSAVLEKINMQESAAIFAHELAKLEVLKESGLKRLQLVEVSMLVAGFIGLPLAQALSGPTESWTIWLWNFLPIAVFLLKTRNTQNHALFARVRGLELLGDLETYARALGKVYTRSWSLDWPNGAGVRRRRNAFRVEQVEALSQQVQT